MLQQRLHLLCQGQWPRYVHKYSNVKYPLCGGKIWVSTLPVAVEYSIYSVLNEHTVIFFRCKYRIYCRIRVSRSFVIIVNAYGFVRSSTSEMTSRYSSTSCVHTHPWRSCHSPSAHRVLWPYIVFLLEKKRDWHITFTT